MGCGCKSKAEKAGEDGGIKIAKDSGVIGEDIKSNLPQKILNLLFRIFVFLFVLGLILPIMIPLTIVVIFNVIFVTHSFNLTVGLKKIIYFLEKKYNIDFKNNNYDDYIDEDDFDEEQWEINKNEVDIIEEKEKQDVR
jgi:hypothetical protein